MQAYKIIFRNAIPSTNRSSAPRIKKELHTRVATYVWHVHNHAQNKQTHFRFKSFLTKLDQYINKKFSKELGQAWQQLVQETDKEAVTKKHTDRIAFLRSLLAYLPERRKNGATGADEQISPRGLS